MAKSDDAYATPSGDRHLAGGRSTRGPRDSDDLAGPLKLSLMGGLNVVAGSRKLPVPEGGQRLLVFVALHYGKVDRRCVAGTLWPDGDDNRSAGNLRTALWRLRGAGIHIVQGDHAALWLDPFVEVDVRVIDLWAGRIMAGQACVEDLRIVGIGLDGLEIVPGWCDEWVVTERERLRQRLLHGLEGLSRELVRRGLYAQAIEAALEAVRFEPLRESSYRALVAAHLAEGNVAESTRVFQEFVDLARRELGVAPSSAFCALVEASMPGDAVTRLLRQL